MTRFWWTVQPGGDLSRTRLLPGADILVVASAFWVADRRRFRVARPPADHIGQLAIDSGGFTAAKRWGAYPWTPQQYIDWIGEESRDVPLAWAAIMDYACEREVNRSGYATNRARIKATIRNDAELRRLAPAVPWLSVLQGNSFQERALDLRLRRRLGMVYPLMGIGSICRRLGAEAAQVVRWYGDQLPATQFHAFGLDARTLDQGPDVAGLLESWDSYAWNWPRGAKGKDRPADLHRRPGERYGAYILRCATAYQAQTIGPRLARPTQPRLW